MKTKQNIIDEICKTAKENGDKPLGVNRFEKETGITRYDLYKAGFSNLGEAQREAGFVANTLQIAHDTGFLLESMIALIREKGKFPTKADLIVKRNKDSKFPNSTSINNRLGSKREKATKISSYAKQKGYEDIVELCEPIIENSAKEKLPDHSDILPRLVGEVYLFKSGRYYKIGKTNDTVRRGSELRIQLPEKCVLIHSIKTDDPSGIEAYWHRRFEKKRLNGEWFDLSSADVKAFSGWRRIV